MKTGAEIVAELEAECHTPQSSYRIVHDNWPTIRAALLGAHTPPPSPLRTILDCAPHMGFTEDEIAVARAELDRLERK